MNPTTKPARTEPKIVTEYQPKPGASRNLDWSAIDDATYDYDSPVGYGATEAEAIADLKAQLEELRPEAA